MTKRTERTNSSLSVRLVVSCTKRKRFDPAPYLCLDSLMGDGSLTRRAQAWTRRLRDHREPVFAVRDLYAGDHWAVAQSIEREGAVEAWVASAGLGLIPFSASVPSYSATFTAGESDAVTGQNDSRGVALKRAWWAALSGWSGPDAEQPRTLAALAERDPHSPVVCVAAPTYLEAVQDDLLEAARALSSPDLLVIVSAGSVDGSPDLAPHLVPCDARFQQTLGGALSALNVRVARRIVEERDEHPIRASALRARWTGLLNLTAPLEPVVREPMTDDAVRTYISKSLKRNPSLRPTPMLRDLRESGRACEHHRFRNLFNSVAEEVLHGA